MLYFLNILIFQNLLIIMGNNLLAECQRDENCKGFTEDYVKIEHHSAIQFPSRSYIVEKIYKKLTEEKPLHYTLETQKPSYKPIIINIFKETGRYVGDLKNDRPHGRGQIYFDNGNFLEAVFINGVVDCEDSIFIDFIGNYYRGNFKESKQSGTGKLGTREGIISASFVDGLAQGKGQMILKDGSIYKGNFKNGQRSGRGILQHQKKSSIYEGYFRENKKNGIGYLKTKNYQYFGPFKDDKKSGKGLIIFNNGSRFQGWFRQDRMQGYGEWDKLTYYQKGEYNHELTE